MGTQPLPSNPAAVTQSQATDYVRESDFIIRLIDDRRRLDDPSKKQAISFGTIVAAFFLLSALVTLIIARFFSATPQGFDGFLGLVLAAFFTGTALKIDKACRARTRNSTILVLRRGILRKHWTDADESGSNFLIPWSAVQEVRDEEDGVTLLLRGLPPLKLSAASFPTDRTRSTLLTLARSRGDLPKIIRGQ